MKQKRIILFFAIIFIASALFFKITNNDIYFHIKAGEWIVSHHKNIGNNVFSYASGNEKLFNHEVLSQIIFYLWYRFFGLNSLVLLKFIVFGLIFFMFFKENRDIPIEIRAFSLIPLYFLINERLYIRPEMFAYLLGVYLLYFMKKQAVSLRLAEDKSVSLDSRFRGNDKKITGNTKWKGKNTVLSMSPSNYKIEHRQKILVIALISVFWVNLHPSFIIGAILIFLFLLDSFLKKDKKASLLFLQFFLVYIFAALLNSNGINIYSRIFWEITKSSYSAAIAEWISPLKATGLELNSTIITFYIYSISFLLLFLLAKKKRIISILIFAFFGAMSLKHRRFVAFFGFLTISEFALYLNEFARYLKQKFKLKAIMKMFKIIFIVSAIYLSFLILTNKLYIYDRRDLRTGIGINYLTQPVNAANFLKEVKFNRIFSSFDISNYLLYRFYPQKKVFINSFFSKKTMTIYKSIMDSPEEYFPRAENIFGIDIAILKYTNLESAKIIRFLNTRKDWGVHYFDGLVVVFKKNYHVKIQEYYIKSHKRIYPEDYINKGLLFSILGDYPHAIDYYNTALKYRPDAYEAYNNLGNIYKILGQKNKALKMYEQALQLRHNFPEARRNYKLLVGK